MYSPFAVDQPRLLGPACDPTRVGTVSRVNRESQAATASARPSAGGPSLTTMTSNSAQVCC